MKINNHPPISLNHVSNCLRNSFQSPHLKKKLHTHTYLAILKISQQYQYISSSKIIQFGFFPLYPTCSQLKPYSQFCCVFSTCHFLQPVTVMWCLTVIIIKDTGFSTLLFVALSHVLQHLCATCRHMKYNSWKVLEGINA